MEHQASLMKYFEVPGVETKKKTGEVEGKYLQTKNTTGCNNHESHNFNFQACKQTAALNSGVKMRRETILWQVRKQRK